MSRRTGLLLLVGLLLVGALLAWWQLPSLVAAMPVQVRIRLPQHVAALAMTPLPTALPTPDLPTPDLSPTEIPTATPTIHATKGAVSAEATATATPTPIPPTPTPSYPARVQLDGLQIVPQKLNNCGPTNLAIALTYLGRDTDQLDIARVIKPHYEDRNVSPAELVAYTHAQTDLQATVVHGGTLDHLRQLIAAGLPVIIEKGYEPDWQGWMGHYLTVYGYDVSAETFTSLDTFLGPWDNSGRVDEAAALDAFWEQFNRTFVVVYPPEQAGEVAEIVADLAGEKGWISAEAQAQQRVVDAPQDPFGWHNLGVAQYRQWVAAGNSAEDGQLVSAVAAFDEARRAGLPPRMLWYQFELYEAYLAAGRLDDVLTLTQTILDATGGEHVEETFLYRGHALRASGDHDAAYRAYRRALELKPGYAAAEEALAALAQAS